MKIKAKFYITLIVALLASIVCSAEVYALSLEFLNHTDLDFGEMKMGEIKYDVPRDGLKIKCRTSAGTPGWRLKVRLDRPLTNIDDLSSIIPRENIYVYGITTSNDMNNSLLTTPTNLLREVTLYTGAAGEEETDITIKFQMELPPALKQGVFNTNFSDIVFTISE
ncbi:MAG: hypothetical protein JW800_04970 [Candidatus Omnitrophica bacterium]|nr:hypothetical protein [Candidatus Omnitrophota bacterium]